MKFKALLALISSALFLSAMNLVAGPMYKLNFRATTVSTNGQGDLAKTPVNGRLILLGLALQQEPPISPATLSIVYDVDRMTVSVVQNASGAIIVDLLRFESKLAISNSLGTIVEHIASIDKPLSEDETGVAQGTERITRNEDGSLRTYSFKGKFHLGLPATDTDPAEIFDGTFTTGAKFVPTSPPTN